MNESPIYIESTPEYNLNLVETSDASEVKNIINTIISDDNYSDWKKRIPKFLERYVGNWKMIKILDDNRNIIGFSIISNSPEKMRKWNQKFIKNGWMQEPINLAISVQFAYFYISNEHRGQGFGTKAIEAIKEKERLQGTQTIYGFSRYSKVIPLYQKTGIQILNQTIREGQTRTYYYWDLRSKVNENKF